MTHTEHSSSHLKTSALSNELTGALVNRHHLSCKQQASQVGLVCTDIIDGFLEVVFKAILFKSNLVLGLYLRKLQNDLNCDLCTLLTLPFFCLWPVAFAVGLQENRS